MVIRGSSSVKRWTLSSCQLYDREPRNSLWPTYVRFSKLSTASKAINNTVKSVNCIFHMQSCFFIEDITLDMYEMIFLKICLVPFNILIIFRNFAANNSLSVLRLTLQFHLIPFFNFKGDLTLSLYIFLFSLKRYNNRSKIKDIISFN